MWGSWEESLVINKIKILLLTKTSSKIQKFTWENSIVVKEEELFVAFGEREGKLQRERERGTQTQREKKKKEIKNKEKKNKENKNLGCCKDFFVVSLGFVFVLVRRKEI